MYEDDRITVYSDTVYDTKEIARVVARVDSLLNNASVTGVGAVTIILTSSEKVYSRKRFYQATGSLAGNYMWFNLIVFRPMDVAHDMSNPVDANLQKRPFSAVMAHELCHSWQRKRLGILKFLYYQRTRPWKLDGFADYVAQSSSLNEKDGVELFLAQDERTSWFEQDRGLWGTVYFYLKSRMRVDYLLRCKGIDEDEFWSADYDEQKLDDEIRHALKTGAYQFPIE